MDLSISSSSEPEMKVTLGKGGYCPVKATEGAAGFDLTNPKTIRISPGAVYCIDTEVAIELPVGYAGFIQTRSSYAVKGLAVLGGIIDGDFRGRLQVLVTAVGDDSIMLIAGMRFAQIVPFLTGSLGMHVVAELTPTKRGTGMMGSTNTSEVEVMGHKSQVVHEIDEEGEDEDDDDDDGESQK